MIETFHLSSWDTDTLNNIQQPALNALEQGKVLFFPNLSFKLSDRETNFLSPALVAKGTKNISFNLKSGLIKGHACSEDKIVDLKDMMERYALCAKHLVEKLLSPYAQQLETARTSFRPAEIEGRIASYRKDDTRLHVDAFPATPTQGRRILRIFSNVNNENKARIWRLGSPFESVATHFLPRLKKPLWGSSILLDTFKITRGKRTAYDHYMLLLHDAMKFDMHYQNTVSQMEFHFPAGSTWIVYTDQVSHAAMAGQHAFEQTFHLPRQALVNVDTAPQTVLEKMLKKQLT